MLPLSSVKNLKPGDTGLSASQMNAIFEAVKKMHQSWILAGGMRSAQIAGQQVFGPPTRDFEPVLGIVYHQGPLLQPDFTGINGHQYWVQTAITSEDTVAEHAQCLIRARTIAERARIVQVENIAESATRGHLLRTDGKQNVLIYRAENSVGVTRWFMNATPTRQFVWVRVSGAVVFGAAGSNEWRYTCIEQEMTIAGWVDKAGGRTFTNVFNGYENANVADPSIRGNGVNSGGADYPAGFDLMPVRGNPVVPIYPELVPQPPVGNPPVEQPDIVQWVISDPNADDGVC